MDAIENRAREMLAAEYAAAGSDKRAALIRSGRGDTPATCYALDAIITALTPQWQPIETAPKDGCPVLLDHPEWHTRVLRGGWDAHAMAWRVHGFGCPMNQPTRWHPLPALPKVSA